MPAKLSVGSLFSGIGGFELGLEMTDGYEVAWQCEIEPFCLKVLEKHWPNVRRFTDIRRMGAEGEEEIPHVDVICGGFPCQPVSCAGKRKGKEDTRWLWPEFCRVVRCVRPEWVLIENVPGLLSADSGRLFAGILRDLSESGYDAEWNIVSAASVGAPHLRKRVFVVAHTGQPRRQQIARSAHGNEAEDERRTTKENNEPERDGESGGTGYVADADQIRRRGRAGMFWQGRGRESEDCCAKLPDARGEGLSQPKPERQHGGPTAECGWWSVEPDVGRVASRLPPGVDGGRCAKRNVMAAIIGDGEWIGYNSCLSPVDVCPRVGNEGYEKCKSICQQTNHAEINAILKAGSHAKDAIIVIYGHDHCCENCLSAIKKAGIKKIVFANYDRVDRLRALGNAIVPQCSQFVGQCVLDSMEADA